MDKRYAFAPVGSVYKDNKLITTALIPLFVTADKNRSLIEDNFGLRLATGDLIKGESLLDYTIKLPVMEIIDEIEPTYGFISRSDTVETDMVLTISFEQTDEGIVKITKMGQK